MNGKNLKVGESDKKTSYGLPSNEVHHHYYYEPDPVKRKRSMKPGIAGVLLIITAVIGLIAGSFMLGGGWFVSNLDSGSGVWDLDDESDVSGQVTMLNGEGVGNASVSIVGEGISTTTDDDGYYRLYSVPIGDQKIMVEKDGYNTYIQKVFVTPSDTEWCNDDHNKNVESGNEFDFEVAEGNLVLEQGEYPDFDLIGGAIFTGGILVITFSLFALAAGIFALKRKNFKLAIVGAVLGIFTIVGILFSIIALFLLIISRDEFKRGEK